MNDVFEQRVRTAAVAGWWTLLIAVVLIALQWGVYLAMGAEPPAWAQRIWGPGMTWPEVQHIWFWIVAVLKLCVWLLAMVVLWLTLWARQLRKRAG